MAAVSTTGTRRRFAPARIALGLACAAAMLAPTPALGAGHARNAAAARSGDAAATRAYLRASYAYARAVHAELGASVAAIQARESAIAAECPSALAYAPRDAAFGELGEEASMTLLYAGVAPERSATLRFVRAVAHLGWSDRKLTQLVRARVAEERAIVTLAQPDLCADIAAWRAGAYAALPPSAAAFLARVHADEAGSAAASFEESPEQVVMRRLARYEQPSERMTAKSIERLEAQASKRMESAVTAARKKLAAALGVAAL